MWFSIQWVTGALTLTAFLAAIAATIYRSKLSHDLQLLHSAPVNRRSQLILAKWASVIVGADALSQAQRYEIARDQIRRKATAFNLIIALIALITVLLAIVTVYYIDKANERIAIENKVIVELNATNAQLRTQVQNYYEKLSSIEEIAQRKSPIDSDALKQSQKISDNTVEKRKQLEGQVANVEASFPWHRSPAFEKSIEDARNTLEETRFPTLSVTVAPITEPVAGSLYASTSTFPLEVEARTFMDEKEVSGYKVWCVPAVLEGVAWVNIFHFKYETSPTRDFLAPGFYSFWLEKAGRRGPSQYVNVVRSGQ